MFKSLSLTVTLAACGIGMLVIGIPDYYQNKTLRVQLQEISEQRDAAINRANQAESHSSDLEQQLSVSRDEAGRWKKMQSDTLQAGIHVAHDEVVQCNTQIEQLQAQIQQRQRAGQITPQNAQMMLSILKLLLH